MNSVRAGSGSRLGHPSLSILPHSKCTSVVNSQQLLLRRQLSFSPGSRGLRALGGERIRPGSIQNRRGPGLHCRADLPDLAGIAPVTAAVYGASLLGGGLFAFTRTGSKGSLGGGVTGGVALGVAFFLMLTPETRDLGNAIGFGAALLFASLFGIRLAATGKPIPSGILLGISALATVIFANAYFQARL